MDKFVSLYYYCLWICMSYCINKDSSKVTIKVFIQQTLEENKNKSDIGWRILLNFVREKENKFHMTWSVRGHEKQVSWHFSYIIIIIIEMLKANYCKQFMFQSKKLISFFIHFKLSQSLNKVWVYKIDKCLPWFCPKIVPLEILTKWTSVDHYWISFHRLISTDQNLFPSMKNGLKIKTQHIKE